MRGLFPDERVEVLDGRRVITGSGPHGERFIKFWLSASGVNDLRTTFIRKSGFPVLAAIYKGALAEK